MTSAETKQRLTQEFSGIKYILTSGMRSKLLLTLYEKAKKLEDLRKELQKPSATILHGLKELETNNLIQKEQKYYKLTSNGYLITTNMIKLIENWYSVNKSELFWNNHDLSDIPEDVLKNIYLLKDAKYINSTTSDLSNAYNTYIKLISTAKKMKMIIPIYSENHFKNIIKLVNGTKLEQLELIVSEELEKSMMKNETIRKSLMENEKVKIKIIKRKIKLFLTISEEFVTLTLFFKDGHYDDSQILIGKDENALKWALNLYRYY
ncbi:helix-turn-helix transcriptional regulator [Methanobrevibacter sp.]